MVVYGFLWITQRCKMHRYGFLWISVDPCLFVLPRHLGLCWPPLSSVDFCCWLLLLTSIDLRWPLLTSVDLRSLLMRVCIHLGWPLLTSVVSRAPYVYFSAISQFAICNSSKSCAAILKADRRVNIIITITIIIVFTSDDLCWPTLTPSRFGDAFLITSVDLRWPLLPFLDPLKVC